MSVVLENKCIEIAKQNGTVLQGYIKLSDGTNCLIFAHYCSNELFYKNFIKVSKDILRVNKAIKRNLKVVKMEVKGKGFKKVWSKGVFSFYGDLRPLAVKAGFGYWGKDGIINNEKYGSNFLLSAVFYK